jgi:hypothetical protein
MLGASFSSAESHNRFHARHRIPPLRCGLQLHGNSQQHRTRQRKYLHRPAASHRACLEEGTATTFDIATQAASDANIAFLDLNAASRPGGTDPGAGQLATLTLPPGIYKAAGGTFLITGGDLTLEAQSDTSAVWEFQTASSFTVGAAGVPRNVLLINGAQARTCSGKWAAPPPSIPRAAAPCSARVGHHGEHRNQRSGSINPALVATARMELRSRHPSFPIELDGKSRRRAEMEHRRRPRPAPIGAVAVLGRCTGTTPLNSTSYPPLLTASSGTLHTSFRFTLIVGE